MPAPILYDKRGPVAELVLNRPEARNALTPEMLCRMADAVVDFAADAQLRVLLIRAEGGKAFCAGGDLGLSIPLLTGARPAQDAWDERVLHDPVVMRAASLRDYPLHKPVIALVDGFCFAAGFELLLGTDIRLATPQSSFCLPEAQRAVIPFAGSMARLPRQIPYCHAMELLLTGEPVGAERALQMGLLNRLVAADALLAQGRAIAKRIAANGPLAVQAIKQTVTGASGLPLAAGLALEDAAWARVRASADAQEGPRAFIEKRQPIYKGQ